MGRKKRDTRRSKSNSNPEGGAKRAQSLRHSALGSWDDDGTARKPLIALYAGIIAVLQARADTEAARDGERDDFGKAMEISPLLGGDDEARLLAEARQFFLKQWKDIEPVAVEMLRHERRVGDEVAFLIALAEGNRDAMKALAMCRGLLRQTTAQPPERVVRQERSQFECRKRAVRGQAATSGPMKKGGKL